MRRCNLPAIEVVVHEPQKYASRNLDQHYWFWFREIKLARLKFLETCSHLKRLVPSPLGYFYKPIFTVIILQFTTRIGSKARPWGGRKNCLKYNSPASLGFDKEGNARTDTLIRFALDLGWDTLWAQPLFDLMIEKEKRRLCLNRVKPLRSPQPKNLD